MKKIIRIFTGRLFIRSLIILLQLAILIAIPYYLSTYSIYIQGFLILLSLVLALTIVNNDSNPVFKISWLIPMLTVPVVGWVFYFAFERRKVPNKTEKKYRLIMDECKKICKQDCKIFLEVEEQSDAAARMFKYIYNTSGMCVYKGTQTKFFSTGEAFYKSFLLELEKAEKFIFLEYFIIEEGKLWNSVLEILKRKAAQGIEVRIMYDDLGTIALLDKNYHKTLEGYGIKTMIFNPFRASIDTFLNYRDHRKITVVDGNVGFTGGLNLADEYINKKVRFGYWKDCAIMIKGDAVSAMSTMFLQLWELSCPDERHTACDYKQYYSQKSCENDGYVQPFGDGPINGNLTGELAYMGIINSAKRYVYITTPYLILDNEMITALTLAAKSGIDVRIVTPNIPDKKYVHAVTRSNYSVLIRNGVKIYEYLPGFIHSKTIVSDDKYAIVGTANFDFRSFYLHFENGIFMYKSSAVSEVKEDYEEILKDSKRISYEDTINVSLPVRMTRSVLRIFSPLM